MACSALCCRSYDTLSRLCFSRAPCRGSSHVLQVPQSLPNRHAAFFFFLRVFSRWEMAKKTYWWSYTYIHTAVHVGVLPESRRTYHIILVRVHDRNALWFRTGGDSFWAPEFSVTRGCQCRAGKFWKYLESSKVESFSGNMLFKFWHPLCSCQENDRRKTRKT